MGIATHLAFMAALPSSACRVSIDLSWLRCSSASLCSCCTSSSIRNGYPCEGKGGTPLAGPLPDGISPRPFPANGGRDGR